ncbi:hypothetical protein Acr_00g0072910 [Actinidia rufa]|uniref:Uncharacterized protein n=1 Tax=Actinidia rufa TaxID=165716 RepID=A0A7J0DRZ8_9ERIC|nr:hypothetical protein Acr_00g0072910 [Actinidia rufa]
MPLGLGWYLTMQVTFCPLSCLRTTADRCPSSKPRRGSPTELAIEQLLGRGACLNSDSGHCDGNLHFVRVRIRGHREAGVSRGVIREFSLPVTVSHALDKNPAWFVCNSDEMEFDDFISAVDDDEELRIGQLYFALPAKRQLHAEDMAPRVDPLVFFDKKYCKSRRDVVYGGHSSGGGMVVEERRARSGNAGRQVLTRKLSMIMKE